MRYLMTLKIFFIFATVCLIAPAWAGNLVTNPGFETGDLTGWTNGGQWLIDTGAPQSGTYDATNGCVTSSCITDPSYGSWLYQDLTTAIGQAYDLSFWYNSFGNVGTELDVLWGGTSVIDLVNVAAGYNQYSVPGLLATPGPTTQLEFLGRQDPSFLHLDNVSVTQSGGVPEPATFALLAGGFLLIGGLRRRLRA